MTEQNAERLGPWMMELNFAEVQILIEALESLRHEVSGEMGTGALELIDRLNKLFSAQN